MAKARKTDPIKKKKTAAKPKKKTFGKTASSMALSKKAYMAKADSMGLDTSKVYVKNGIGRLKQSGASKEKISSRNKPIIRGHFKNKSGGVTRLSSSGSNFRTLERGFRVPSKRKLVTKKKK